MLAALLVVRWRIAPYPAEAPFTGGMPLAAALARWSVAHGWWAAAVAALVVAWTLIVVVQLSIKYAPAASRNYLPPQVYLIGAGGVAIAAEALAALIAALLLTLAIRRFATSHRKGYAFSEVFHGGFYLGLIPLLYAPATVPVVAIAIGSMIVYRRSLREAVVCLTGLGMGVPAAGFIHWALGEGGGHIYRELWRCTLEARPVIGRLPWPALALAAAVVIVSLAGIFWVMANKKNIRKAQYKFIAGTSLVFPVVGLSILSGGTSTTLCALLAVPCAVCFPWAFAPRIAGFSTTVYCLIMVAVLVIHLPSVLGFYIP